MKEDMQDLTQESIEQALKKIRDANTRISIKATQILLERHNLLLMGWTEEQVDELLK